MKSDKYLEFWINDEIYIQEIELLKRYEFFQKAIDNANNFKQEEIHIEFPISRSLVSVAFKIHDLKYGTFGFEESCQIYDFLKYLLPINFSSIVGEIIYHYKPCCNFEDSKSDDYKKIIELDNENYKDIRLCYIEKYISYIDERILVKPINFTIDKFNNYCYENDCVQIHTANPLKLSFIEICKNYLGNFGIPLDSIKLYHPSRIVKKYNYKAKLETHYYRVDELMVIINGIKFIESGTLDYFPDEGKRYKDFNIVRNFNIVKIFNKYILHINKV